MVDFAFSIHTQLGHKMLAAKVNGRLVNPKHQLSNGEVVEILRDHRNQVNTPFVPTVHEWYSLCEQLLLCMQSSPAHCVPSVLCIFAVSYEIVDLLKSVTDGCCVSVTPPQTSVHNVMAALVVSLGRVEFCSLLVGR